MKLIARTIALAVAVAALSAQAEDTPKRPRASAAKDQQGPQQNFAPRKADANTPAARGETPGICPHCKRPFGPERMNRPGPGPQAMGEQPQRNPGPRRQFQGGPGFGPQAFGDRPPLRRFRQDGFGPMRRGWGGPQGRFERGGPGFGRRGFGWGGGPRDQFGPGRFGPMRQRWGGDLGFDGFGPQRRGPGMRHEGPGPQRRPLPERADR